MSLLADKIKRARLCKGMSQKELADALYVTQQTISRWERGLTEPQYQRLRDIQQALGLSKLDMLDLLQSYKTEPTIPKDEPKMIMRGTDPFWNRSARNLDRIADAYSKTSGRTKLDIISEVAECGTIDHFEGIDKVPDYPAVCLLQETPRTLREVAMYVLDLQAAS